MKLIDIKDIPERRGSGRTFTTIRKALSLLKSGKAIKINIPHQKAYNALGYYRRIKHADASDVKTVIRGKIIYLYKD